MVFIKAKTKQEAEKQVKEFNKKHSQPAYQLNPKSVSRKGKETFTARKYSDKESEAKSVAYFKSKR